MVIIIIIILNMKSFPWLHALPSSNCPISLPPFTIKFLKKKKKITYVLCFALFTFYPLISIHSNQALFPLSYWNCYCHCRLWTPSCQKQRLKFLSLYSALQWQWSQWMRSFPCSISLTRFWETAHLASLLPFCPPSLAFLADSSSFLPSPLSTLSAGASHGVHGETLRCTRVAPGSPLRPAFRTTPSLRWLGGLPNTYTWNKTDLLASPWLSFHQGRSSPLWFPSWEMASPFLLSQAKTSTSSSVSLFLFAVSGPSAGTGSD